MADAGDIERFEGVNKATSVDKLELGREIRVDCRRAFDCVTDVGPGWAGGDRGGDGHGLAVVGWRDAEICLPRWVVGRWPWWHRTWRDRTGGWLGSLGLR